MIQATHFLHMLQKKKSNGFSPHLPPPKKKKQTKGLGYKQCSFWEKSSLSAASV